ncbi:MAG TPA: hypothetical protein VN229_17000 [Terriglobales bacterium]|nr:hypothetical protein [Terriglobales bacterium]
MMTWQVLTIAGIAAAVVVFAVLQMDGQERRERALCEAIVAAGGQCQD